MNVLQIMVDTEFSSIDVPHPQLISIGAVTIPDLTVSDGLEVRIKPVTFYREFFYDMNQCSDFVKDEVIKRLTGEKGNFFDFIKWVEYVREVYAFSGHVEFIVTSQFDADIIEAELKRIQLGCDELLVSFSFRFRLLCDVFQHLVSKNSKKYGQLNMEEIRRRPMTLYRHLIAFTADPLYEHNALYDAKMQRNAMMYVNNVISRGEI